MSVGEDVTPEPEAEDKGLLETFSSCSVIVDCGNIWTTSVIVCGIDDEAAAEVS